MYHVGSFPEKFSLFRDRSDLKEQRRKETGVPPKEQQCRIDVKMHLLSTYFSKKWDNLFTSYNKTSASTHTHTHTHTHTQNFCLRFQIIKEELSTLFSEYSVIQWRCIKQIARHFVGSNFKLTAVVEETARLETAAGYHFGAEWLFSNCLPFSTDCAHQENVTILYKLNGAVGLNTALQAGRSRVRFPMVSLEFSIDIILPGALCPWGQLNL